MKDKKRKAMTIISESEKTARRLLIKATEENRFPLPEFSEVPLTDKECRSIAKHHPFSVERIREWFPEIERMEVKLEKSDGSELLTISNKGPTPIISIMPETPTSIHLYLKDINGENCEIDMLDLLKVLHSLAPELMDKLWEKARKEKG